jgi:hypothetical protein
MQLDPDAFNALLNEIGQHFTWRKSYACPCVNPATASPRLDCPHCSGKGVLWVAPVAGVAAVPSQKVQREYSKIGQWESGDMILSIPSDSTLYGIAERDRVVQLNGHDPFSINLRRGVNDRLPWRVRSIDRVFWIAGAALVDGGPATQQENGILAFTGVAPPAGSTYSVTGSKFSEFFVYRDFPTDRGHHFGKKLPVKVQLRRFDLFGR